MFASHSQAKEFQVHFQLTNLSRGDQSISEYFGKVRSLADTLVATSSPLPGKEFVTYLLYWTMTCLPVTTRVEPLSSHELYQLLLIHESHISHIGMSIVSFIEPSANFSATGTRDQRGQCFTRGGHQGRGRGRSNYNNNGRGGHYSSSSPSNNQQTYTAHRPTCQVCNKSDHVALQCRHHFYHSYQFEAPQSFSANYTTPGSFSDATWYPDLAATHHITHDLSNLNLSSKQYTSCETI
ncbi:hypothetical protein F2P56_012448 [Juglans regia]|uniref:Retrotransposon gag domain-containing protein n=1 Tax=Juglans regia TaxID=51240 RepID=A0A833XLY7_JUGRE|nr:hypothetical protein F2P56_012448 [Juglans regia]